MTSRYENGKVYKLVCTDGHYYIGSTTQKLNIIFNRYKYLSKTCTDRVYEHINTIGWDKVNIQLIEDYPCNNKKELSKREEFYINDDFLCLNNELEEVEDSEEEIEVEESEESNESEEDDKYNNGKIYKLVCTDGYYYIGSTSQMLYLRLNHHKSASKIGKSCVYNHINMIGWDKVKIELIEDYPCNNKKELNKREEFYIDKFKSKLCLNMISAYRSKQNRKEKQKKYFESHKEDIMKYYREYNEENKEKIQTYKALYRLENKEKIQEYTKKYITEHQEERKESKKIHYEKNKEKILETNRKYKEKNKEKVAKLKKDWAIKNKEENKEQNAKKSEEKRQLREKKKEDRIKHDNTIITCECGGTYQNYRKQRHYLSKMHIAKSPQ